MKDTIIKRTLHRALQTSALEVDQLNICERIVSARSPDATMGSLMLAAMDAEREACAAICERADTLAEAARDIRARKP